MIDAPDGKSTVSLMSPEPAILPDAPPARTAVQVTPVRSLGKVSVTVAPVTSDGPLLDATIV